MSVMLMMIAYGKSSDGGDDVPVNLIDDPYFTGASRWESVTTGSTETHGIDDESGGNNAVRINFVGTNGHQAWYDLPSALTEGDAYKITTYLRTSTANSKGPYQIAYYTGGSSVNDERVNITDSYQPYTFKFFAGADANNDPSIRLIGSGYGNDGEYVDIGKTELLQMETRDDGAPLISLPTPVDDPKWGSTTNQTLTYNVEDGSGGNSATRVELIGTDNHHLEYLLDNPLVEGEAYTLSIRFKAGPNGFTGNFQLAYYGDGSSVNSTDLAVPATYETKHFKFFAGSAGAVDPTIRLIGYSNGNAGDQVDIESIQLVAGTNPAFV